MVDDVKVVNFVLGKVTNVSDTQKELCNYAVCRKCGGICCQGAGCVLSPEDVYVLTNSFTYEERVRYLKHLLNRGYLSIDYWPVRGWVERKCDGTRPSASAMQEMGILYLRARNTGKGPIDTEHYKWEPPAPCASWSSENGCKFPFNKRPKGGRALIPGLIPGVTCFPGYPELMAATEWLKFSRELGKVYEYFRRKERKGNYR